LKLERFIAVNTDEVGCDYFYEIFDEVVGEHRRR
jgi:hypothetical protein